MFLATPAASSKAVRLHCFRDELPKQLVPFRLGNLRSDSIPDFKAHPLKFAEMLLLAEAPFQSTPSFGCLTPALSCTADEGQGQCAAAFSAEPGPPRWQAESRVSLNAWLAAVDTIGPIVWVPVVVHDGDDKDRSVLA